MYIIPGDLVTKQNNDDQTNRENIERMAVLFCHTIVFLFNVTTFYTLQRVDDFMRAAHQYQKDNGLTKKKPQVWFESNSPNMHHQTE
jgi:hypothetical protein